jgi:uncharacterized protein YndB with AHSA1/START domain
MNTPRTLVIEREMAHPAEKIWRALTQGDLIKVWLMENDFQPVVGHKFNFRLTPMPNWNGVIEGAVLVVEPNKKLSYTWVAMGQETVVSWTLTPTQRGTLVHLEQSGFGPEQGKNYNGAKNGWQSFIGKLDRVVADLE